MGNFQRVYMKQHWMNVDNDSWWKSWNSPGNCPPDDEVSRSILLFAIRPQAGPQGWRQRGQQHSGREMLTNGTKMPVIDGSVTIMLIGSIRGIKIWHQNAFRSVVPVLSPSGRSAGISMRISKWVPVLPCQWFSRLSKLKNIFVSLWPFERMLIASSSLWQMQRFNIWQDNSLLSTKSVIYKRKRCFINTTENCVLIGVLFPNNFQVWANLLSKVVCEEAIVK